MSADQQLTPEQVRFVTKVRRLMIIASATTFIALAFVMGVIGYRIFDRKESVHAADVVAELPKGTRILSTMFAGDKIIVTLELGTTTEIRIFDLQNLHLTGRLRFTTEP